MINTGNILFVLIVFAGIALGYLWPSKNAAGRFAGGLIVFLIVLVGIAEPYQKSSQIALSCMTIIVCAYPLFRYIHLKERYIPFIPILCIIYGAYFALPVFIPFDVYYRFKGVSEQNQIHGLTLILVGITAMLITYYALPRNAWVRFVPQLRSAGWSEVRAVRAALVMGIVGSASYLISTTLTVPVLLGSILNFCTQFSLLSITILFYIQLQGRLQKKYIIFLWCALLPTHFLIDISTGLLYSLFRDGFMILMTYLFVKKRMPWGTAFVAVSVCLLLLMVKGEYRALMSKSDVSNPFSKALVYLDLAQEFGGDQSDKNMQDALEVTVNRFDNRALLNYVVELTPGRVAYWDGQTYMGIIWRFIPRIIWPGKPSEELGQGFGHRYDILDEDDVGTSWNLPQIVEMYVNFGDVGVIVGMMMIGIIYHLCRHFLESGRAGEWGIIMSIIIYTSLLQIDSNFTLVFGNLIYWIVLFYLIGRFIFRNSKSPLRQ